MAHTGRIVVSTQGDATIPAGDHADVVFVTGGVATIAGEVNTLVVIDGSAVVSGATVETIVAVRSPVDLSGGTQVLGDVMTVDSTVTKDASVVVGGSVRDLAQDLAGLWWVIAPMALPVLHRVLGGRGRRRSAAGRPGLPPGPLRRAADGAGAVHDARRRHRRRHRADPAGGAAERDHRRGAAGPGARLRALAARGDRRLPRGGHRDRRMGPATDQSGRSSATARTSPRSSGSCSSR